MDFTNFQKSFNSQEKKGITEWRIPALQLAPIYTLSMTSILWNFSTGQPGLAAWLYSLPGPAHLLIAEYWKLKKVRGFLATTENISVINILLVLNPKHSSYWEEN